MELTPYKTEQVVLAYCLQDYKNLVNGEVREEYFSSEPHQIIFQVLRGMQVQGLSPELNLVVSYLEAEGLIEQVGGDEYLGTLHNTETEPGNFPAYVDIIREAFKKRVVLSTANQVHDDLMRGDKVSDEVIAYLLGQITSLNGATSTSNIKSMQSLMVEYGNVLNERMLSPGITGSSTGYPVLDGVIDGFYNENFVVIGARTGVGKTTLMTNIIGNSPDVPSVVFSGEMGDIRVMDRIVAKLARVPMIDLKRGNLGDDKVVAKRVTDTMRNLHNNYQVYVDDSFHSGIDYVASAIRKYYHMYGVQRAYVDYIQLLGKSDTTEINKITATLKALTIELDMCIIGLAQVRRLGTERVNMRPTLEHLKDSGTIEQDADTVLFLHRGEEDEDMSLGNEDLGTDMEVIVAKNRDGKTATIPFLFKGDISTIEEYNTFGRQQK